MKHRTIAGTILTVAATALILFAFLRNSRPAAAAPRFQDPPQELRSANWPQLAPEFRGTAADWLNTAGKALSLKELIATRHVVLVDFWEYTCVNCLRTIPYLQEWNKRYAKDGLVIVGIHTPEFQFAKDPHNVAEAVKRLGITWPVLIDSDYHNWNAYHNGGWPHKFFINDRGLIVADHFGEGAYDRSEALIQQLLKQAHPDLTFPKVMAPVRDADKPGAVCYLQTPEMYVGERGAQQDQHGNLDTYVPGQLGFFDDPGTHEDGKVYAQGAWRMEPESLRHGRTTTALQDYIALRYHALECNAVIKPEGDKPFRVTIIQDGKPIAKQDKGADIQYDEKGNSYIQVDTPRMYRLTANARFGSHELRLASNSPDFGLYSFTFTSCEMK
ncbi:MAG TPA: redoxin domain-containing protein [Chthonomonadaceae bacterium]|nr:redoxin domain-containing protein [Chthonomonadaceae bacterium]